MNPPPHDSGDTEPIARVQRATLEGLSAAANYRRWICELARPWLGDDPLEIGSGIGDYAEELRQLGVAVTASEHDPSLVTQLVARFAGSDVGVRSLSLPVDLDATYSAVLAINVLEHIADDVAALRSMARLCEPGGHVVVFVPAFQFAFSRFDREVGHFRRYRRRMLTDKMEQAGLEVCRGHYVNMPGLLAWFVIMRVLRQRPQEGVALRMFEWLVPLLKRFESIVRPPFGQSVFAVGRA